VLGFAERCGILAQVVAAMAKARIVTPRSEAARRLAPGWDLADVARSDSTTQGIMETLAHESLATGRSGFSSMARIPIVHWSTFSSRRVQPSSRCPYVYLPPRTTRR